MTQRDALREMDSIIHGAFLGAGHAFSGGYRAPGVAFSAPATPVRGFLDRGVEFVGEFGQVAGRRDEIELLMADVTPANGGHVDADGLRFVLVSMVDQDDGSARYVVRDVPIP